MELDKVPTSALDHILEDLHIKCASRLLSDIHNILDPYQMRFIDVPGLIAFLRRVGKDIYHPFVILMIIIIIIIIIIINSTVVIVVKIAIIMIIRLLLSSDINHHYYYYQSISHLSIHPFIFRPFIYPSIHFSPIYLSIHSFFTHLSIHPFNFSCTHSSIQLPLLFILLVVVSCLINCDDYVYSSVTGKIAAQKLDDFFDKHMIVRYANSDDDDDDDD